MTLLPSDVKGVGALVLILASTCQHLTGLQPSHRRINHLAVPENINHKTYATVENCEHGACERYLKSLLTLNHDISEKKRNREFKKKQLESL